MSKPKLDPNRPFKFEIEARAKQAHATAAHDRMIADLERHAEHDENYERRYGVFETEQ